MNNSILASFLVACTAILATGCSSTPKWAHYAAPPAGTTWSNQIKGTGSYKGPAEVSSRIGEITWNGERHVAFHNGPSTLVARRDGSWVALLGSDGKPMTSWEPPLGWGFPLEVGATWKASYNVVNHSSGKTTLVDASYAAEAFEEVTVPAGTFKAYRLRMTNNIGDDNTWWLCPENGLFVKQRLVRTESSPFGVGTREAELKTLSVGK
jgi:hypothetical protein